MNDLHVSPSQIDTFEHVCQRAWGWDKIAKIPRPPNPYADRGTGVHAVLEDWQRKAKPLDLSSRYGKIAFPALQHTPPPLTPGVTPEREETWRVDGVTIVFKIDLEQNYPHLFKITDYKTCSNLAFKKTPEYLLEQDPQGTIYPAYGFSKRPDLSTIGLEWLYLTTSEKYECLPVRAVAEAASTRERFAKKLELSRYMLDKRRLQVHPLTLQPNPRRCRHYFGKPCPYRHLCTDITPELEFELAMTELSHTNADNLAFLNSLGGATPPGPPAPPSAAPAVAPFPPAAAPFTPPGAGPGAPAAPPAPAQGALPPWMTPGPSAAQVPPPVAQVPPAIAPASACLPPIIPTSEPVAVIAEAPKPKRGRKAAQTPAEVLELVMPPSPQEILSSAEAPTQVEIPRAHPTIPAPPVSGDLRTAMFYELLKCFALNPACVNMAPEDVVNKAATWLATAESAGYTCS